MGAIHHLVGLVLWIQDFALDLLKKLTLYCKSPNSQRLSTHFWIFVLDRGCRHALLELLVFSVIFINQVCLMGSIQGSDRAEIALFSQKVEERLSLQKFNIQALMELLQSIPQSPNFVIPNDLATLNEIEDQMLLGDGAISSHFQSCLDFFQVKIDDWLVSFLGVPVSSNLDLENFFKAMRSYPLNQYDCILKTNIQSNDLSICTRCKSRTQTAMTTDPLFDKFQRLPAWRNTYQEACFCGGRWVKLSE
jgi:hypothetical protein